MSLPVFEKIRGMRSYFIIARALCRIALLLPAGVFISHIACAQIITLKNPSMEGNIGRDSIPTSWIATSNTPDVLPGALGIFKKPTDGVTYAGLHSGPSYHEGLAQQLSSNLRKGVTYSMAVDLAFAPKYLQAACYANLAIYGGNSPGDTAEKLWSSGAFTDTSWHRFNPIFSPANDYTYISIWADPSDDCTVSPIGSAVLIDNFSSIRELVVTKITSIPSCKHASSGAVQVSITNANAHTPYTYLWTPGNYETPTVEGLPPGEYTVLVTAPNGATGGGTVTVAESDLTTKLLASTSGCAGDHNGEIKVAVSGGLPPYRFTLNDNNMGSDSVYTGLDAGDYHVIVKDGQVCADTLTAILREPQPLELASVEVKPCSCSETTDGKIALKIEGGVSPYKYRLSAGEWQQDSIIQALKAGNYDYDISDANGCELSGSATVTSPYKNCLVVMPTAFSPNGDGQNDLFRPKVYDALSDYELRVYNRWGSLVYQTRDPQAGWDGTFKGMQQDQQAFIYVCTFNDRNNERKEFRGSVVLVR